MSRKRCAVNMAYESGGCAAGSWEEVAITMQQTFCETLGDSDWESYSITEHSYMHKKVGYALFGPPLEAGSEEYDSCKLEKIREICNIIIEQDDHSCLERNSETWMSVVFVCLAVENSGNVEVATEPVFRVPRYCDANDSTANFIDRSGRVYESWKDYLQNNKLPNCSYCYPKNGVYHLNMNHQVDIEFGKTPASKLSTKIWSGLDLATTFVQAGNIGLACATLSSLTVSAPIVATSLITSAVCSAYGIGRSTKEIIDRKSHKETIGLSNSASRNCWLSLVGNTVGILSCGASRIVPKIVQSGNALNMQGRVCVAALNVTSCTVNGINVANEILNLHEKRRKNEICPLDVAQLISSVIFFGHSVLTTKAALNLIQEARQGRLEKFLNSVRSNKYRKVFSSVTRKIVGKSDVSQNGKIIRSVKYIEEVGESFLNNVVIFKPGCNRTSYMIDKSGIMVCIEYFRELILNTARNFVTRVSNSFSQIVFQTVDLISTHSTVSRYENLTAASGSTSAPVAVSGFNLRGHILKLLQGLGEFNIPLALELGAKIFSDLNYPLGKSICDVLKMIYMFVKEVVEDMEKLYKEEQDEEKGLLGSNFSQSAFDQKFRISGERFQYFCSVALRAVNEVGEVFNMLKQTCRVNHRQVVGVESVSSSFSEFRDLPIPWEFTNSNENVPITKAEALQIARALTKEDLNSSNSVVAYSETEVFVVIEDNSISLNVVRIKCVVEDKTLYASVMC